MCLCNVPFVRVALVHLFNCFPSFVLRPGVALPSPSFPPPLSFPASLPLSCCSFSLPFTFPSHFPSFLSVSLFQTHSLLVFRVYNCFSYLMAGFVYVILGQFEQPESEHSVVKYVKYGMKKGAAPLKGIEYEGGALFKLCRIIIRSRNLTFSQNL